MRKIFISAIAATFALGVYADDVVTKLDKNKVMYLTNDTITSALTYEEDPDTGEEIEVMGGKYWTGANCIDAFNACGMPLAGTSSTQTQFKFNTRNNYVDPATGFTMEAGAYRGVFVDGTIELQGALGGNNIKGYTNCKGVVLYFFPIPTTWKADGSIPSTQDYPTGRVQAKYFKQVDGVWTQSSGQIYREIHIDMTAGENDGDGSEQVIKNTNILGFQRNADNPLEITVDQPYKLTVWLNNDVNQEELYNTLDPNRTNDRKDEFLNLVCQEGSTEAEMQYFFAKKGTACPYDPTDGKDHGPRGSYDTDSATGWDAMTNSWGDKDEWDAENTAIYIGVKKRMYLVGMALLSATPNAATEYMNAADGLKAKWEDSAKAYCAHPADPAGIDIVEVREQSSNAAFNLAGQRVNANAKGIVIMNGKKFINK